MTAVKNKGNKRKKDPSPEQESSDSKTKLRKTDDSTEMNNTRGQYQVLTHERNMLNHCKPLCFLLLRFICDIHFDTNYYDIIIVILHCKDVISPSALPSQAQS